MQWMYTQSGWLSTHAETTWVTHQIVECFDAEADPQWVLNDDKCLTQLSLHEIKYPIQYQWLIILSMSWETDRNTMNSVLFKHVWREQHGVICLFGVKVNYCKTESLLVWLGLDLFNDDTRPSGHISRPTQVNVSQSCFHTLKNYSSPIILSMSWG